MNERTNERTSKQTNKQTNRHTTTHKYTNKQTNGEEERYTSDVAYVKDCNFVVSTKSLKNRIVCTLWLVHDCVSLSAKFTPIPPRSLYSLVRLILLMARQMIFPEAIFFFFFLAHGTTDIFKSSSEPSRNSTLTQTGTACALHSAGRHRLEDIEHRWN